MSEERLRWTVNDRAIAYSCPGFDVVHEDVSLPDGTETDFDYLSEPASVVILPFTPGGDVVMIEEWRQAVKRLNRGIPAGTVEPDDASVAAAAERELEEETGYVADRLEPLGQFEPANGLANSSHHYFVAHDCQPDGTPSHDVDETIRVRVTPYDALWSQVMDNEIPDGRTALGVLYHRIQTA